MEPVKITKEIKGKPMKILRKIVFERNEEVSKTQLGLKSS